MCETTPKKFYGRAGATLSDRVAREPLAYPQIELVGVYKLD
jgi:hypothetical protein